MQPQTERLKLRQKTTVRFERENRDDVCFSSQRRAAAIGGDEFGSIQGGHRQCPKTIHPKRYILCEKYFIRKYRNR